MLISGNPRSLENRKLFQPRFRAMGEPGGTAASGDDSTRLAVNKAMAFAGGIPGGMVLLLKAYGLIKQILTDDAGHNFLDLVTQHPAYQADTPQERVSKLYTDFQRVAGEDADAQDSVAVFKFIVDFMSAHTPDETESPTNRLDLQG